VAQLFSLGSIEHFMQTKTVLLIVGVILVALGLLSIVPDFLRIIRSNASTETMMVKNYWLLAVVIGALLCLISFFIGKKHG